MPKNKSAPVTDTHGQLATAKAAFEAAKAAILTSIAELEHTIADQREELDRLRGLPAHRATVAQRVEELIAELAKGRPTRPPCARATPSRGTLPRQRPRTCSGPSLSRPH
jgi:hypothetical protein